MAAQGASCCNRSPTLATRCCCSNRGGIDFDAAVQQLNAADNIGLPYYDLLRARLRFFGGTTAI